jgi:hypothetical protein
MKKIFYEKIGRKYVPVAEYDNDYMSSFPKGNTLVMCYPGGTSRRFNVEPALAPMIAAGRYAQDAMCKAITKACELRPTQTAITEGQRKAWRKLSKEFGNELCTLQGASTHDIADAGLNAMMEEANKLLQHESVKQAYDHFLLVCALTQENKTET